MQAKLSMRCLLSLSLVLAVPNLPTAAVAGTTCTYSMQNEILSSSLVFKDWDNLHQFYSKYFSCGDDGAIAEGYSDAVVKLLANHWNLLPRLATIAKSDPSFKSFVVKHIDSTTDADDLARIITQSNKTCPISELVLCGEINQKAKAAEAEIEQDLKKS